MAFFSPLFGGRHEVDPKWVSLVLPGLVDTHSAQVDQLAQELDLCSQIFEGGGGRRSVTVK